MSEIYSQQLITADWQVPPNVKAFTTTRFGGASKPPFDGLNLAGHVGDEKESVAINRKILRDLLPNEPIWLNQHHSCTVVNAAINYAEPPKADASFTTTSGVVCAVLTADCLPVFFTSISGNVVAAAHAGWRGLADGVLEKTAQTIIQKSPNLIQASDLLIYFAPAIGAKSFEVGKNVYHAFVDTDSAYKSAFTLRKNAKFFADIYALAQIQLEKIGVQRFFGGGFDTKTDERFFSYRKAPSTGRLASVIWMDEDDASYMAD